MKLLRSFFAVLTVLCVCGVAEAQVTDPFTITVRSKPLLCGLSGSSYQPVIRRTDQSLAPASAELRTVRGKIKKAKGAALKKLKREESTLKSTIARGKNPCRTGPNQPGAQRLVVAPTPTPTPGIPVGCFVAGNNTVPGCFGIPNNMSGNIDRGQTFYQANCRGCHDFVKNNRSWGEVSRALNNIPQMRPFRPADQTIADVVAYLNRFNF
jgi:hypothetical protein